MIRQLLGLLLLKQEGAAPNEESAWWGSIPVRVRMRGGVCVEGGMQSVRGASAGLSCGINRTKRKGDDAVRDPIHRTHVNLNVGSFQRRRVA